VWTRAGAGGKQSRAGVLDWCGAGTGAEQGEQERLEAVCRSSHAGARGAGQRGGTCGAVRPGRTRVQQQEEEEQLCGTQDNDVQVCVCGCGTGGAKWNGLRELEREVRGAGSRRHTYVEVSTRLSAMTQERNSGLAMPWRDDSARTRTGKAMEPRVKDVGDR
jgi:hypothetical protein